MPDPDPPLDPIIDSLPIDRLIGEPLDAMIKAQVNAGLQYLDFVRTQCVKDGKAVMLEFDYDETLVDTEGSYRGVHQKTMRIPLLAMVTHPTLSLQDGTVDFEMEVTHFTKAKGGAQEETAPAGPIASMVEGPQRGIVMGKVSHKSQQTRRTDTRARYSIHAAVKREDTPEAMMRVIDFLTDAATKPVLVPAKGGLKSPEGLPKEGTSTPPGAADKGA
jgi:hypothetical protein